MDMLNSERVRLIELARNLDSSAASSARSQINAVLAAEPATYPVTITFQVRDPYLELGDSPQSYELSGIITDAVIEELAPEWFQKEHGAGWYVDATKDGTGNTGTGGWTPIEVPTVYSSAQIDKNLLREQLLEVIEGFDTRTWGQALDALAKIESLIRA
jgi:hypothetical protein